MKPSCPLLLSRVGVVARTIVRAVETSVDTGGLTDRPYRNLRPWTPSQSR
jgi:hypothetical protein